MDTGPRGAGRRRWAILAAVGVAGVVIGGGVYLAQANSDPGATPTSTSSTTATPGPTLPVGAYVVSAGEGGTSLAKDGRTPIGYASDCIGAVSAATNYYVAVKEALFQDRLTATEFDALLDEINAGLDANSGPITDLKAEFRSIRQTAEDQDLPFVDPEYHPEWGAFRVDSCNDQASATVSIAGLFTSEHPDVKGRSYPDGALVRVQWFEGDWRLLDVAALEDDPAAVLPIDTPAPLPTELRRQMIAAAGAGWTEYSNAP